MDATSSFLDVTGRAIGVKNTMLEDNLLLVLLLILAYLKVFDPPWNLAIRENEICVLKTRDIPTLTDPSPPSHQLGVQSPPLRQILLLPPPSQLIKSPDASSHHRLLH